MQGKSEELPRRERIAWALIALTPAIFALASSNPYDPAHPVLKWMRNWAAPVVAVEMAVISLAAGSGFAPLARLSALPKWARIALALLVAIAFGTAILVAGTPHIAFSHALIWAVHLLFGFAVLHLAARSTPDVRARFWPAVAGGLLLYVLILALYVAAIPDPSRFNWLLFRLAASNIRHVGFYTTVGAAVALGLVASRGGAAWFLLWSGASAIMFALAFWSGTRGSVVAIWAAFLLACVFCRAIRTIRSWAALLGATLIGLLLSFAHTVPDKHFGVARISASLNRNSVEATDSSRLSMWRGTWDLILDRPFFGHGQGQFRNIVPEAKSTFNHPHNGLLQALFDWGIIGAACFAALLLCLCWRCVRTLGFNGERQLPAVLVAAGLLTMALYDGSLLYAYPIMMIALSLAWIIGTARDPDAPR